MNYCVSPMSSGRLKTRSTSRHKDIREKHHKKAKMPSLAVFDPHCLFLPVDLSKQNEHTQPHSNTQTHALQSKTALKRQFPPPHLLKNCGQKKDKEIKVPLPFCINMRVELV